MAFDARCDLRCGVDCRVGRAAMNNPLPVHRPPTAIEEIRFMRETLKRIVGEMNKRDMPEQALPLQVVLADLQKLEIDRDQLDWTVP